MFWNRRQLAVGVASAFVAARMGSDTRAQSRVPLEAVDVDLRREIGSLDHIWSRCAGSDRAEITMREEWRSDARRMREETGLKRVRFHGVLDDKMGVWPRSSIPRADKPNFQDVDAVYDGLMDLGLQPWVELSFMPGKLTSGTRTFGMYRANVTPPRSLGDWHAFVGQFVQHLIQRYGAHEVRQWYFEVWNEPNLPSFWSGTQAQYFELYETTANAVKSVDSKIMVGGPATAAVQWIPEFLEYCSRVGAPLDFVSTHLYPADDQKIVFGQENKYRQADVIPTGMAQVRAQIDGTPFKGTELWLSEWSSDSPALIVHVVSRCTRICHGLSHWELSGVFEELRVRSWILREGVNGWGLFAPRNIALPAFNTYRLMNRLGRTRLHATGPAIASRLAHGGSAILIWNLADVTQPKDLPGTKTGERRVIGERKQISVVLNGAGPRRDVRISYVDQRGSPISVWRGLGSPQYMTRMQLAKVRAAAELDAPELRKLDGNGKLKLELPPEGIALLELS
jgi:beta-xylosidase